MTTEAAAERPKKIISEEAAAWGEKLRRLLKNRGITPTQLADRANTTAASVYRYIAGTSRPEMQALERMAGALSMTPGELVDL